MNYRFDYICKLITSIKKSRNINLDIIENNSKFTNTDIRYLILTILMNNGLLFEQNFSAINWTIDRDDFSSFCAWRGLDGKYSNIIDEPSIYDLDDEHIDWSFLDNELVLREHEETVELGDSYHNQGDNYIISIFKDENGNISGSKVMNQIRNKLFHNQYEDYDSGIVLKFAEGELEIEDEDIYVLLKAYLKACSETRAIKQLLYSSRKIQNHNFTSEENGIPNTFNIEKINEMVSMFQFLFLMIYRNSDLKSYSKLQEGIMPFNNILNDINQIDPSIISTISQPDFEKTKLSSLFSMIFVMSDLSQLDLSSISFSFLTIGDEYSSDSNNVIRHIRNSFAHGYFTYSGNNIIIEDYNNRQTKTFFATTSINDFINFALSQNILGKLYDVQYASSIKR